VSTSRPLALLAILVPALAWAANCPDQTAECVPGDSRKPSACLSEWLVENPNSASLSKRPSKTSQKCMEGDPHCDFDGAGNGTCTFHVGLCVGGVDSASTS